MELFEITETASRQQVRKMEGVKSCDHMRNIEFSLIMLRPGFNYRIRPEGITDEMWETELGIPDLADGIYKSNGPANAIIGDFLPDGRFIPNDGERRTRALRFLLDSGLEFYPNGEPIKTVTVIINPAGTTELDRKLAQINTQDNLKLKPMELAYAYLRMKNEDGLTHQQIADYLGGRVSRQTVDNYISATTLPPEKQKMINDGLIGITNSLNIARVERQLKKKEAALKAAETEEPICNEMGEVIEYKKGGFTNLDGDIDAQEGKQPDNTVSLPRAGLNEAASGEAVYVVPEKEIWERALRLIAAYTEQGKSVGFIITELRCNFKIENLK